MDVYGQDAGYAERVMLLYDGLHYDALAVAAFEGAPEELDVTIFRPKGQVRPMGCDRQGGLSWKGRGGNEGQAVKGARVGREGGGDEGRGTLRRSRELGHLLPRRPRVAARGAVCGGRGERKGWARSVGGVARGRDERGGRGHWAQEAEGGAELVVGRW
eukprot:316285-Chlamydomonas_euryale.AAC.1